MQIHFSSNLSSVMLWNISKNWNVVRSDVKINLSPRRITCQYSRRLNKFPISSKLLAAQTVTTLSIHQSFALAAILKWNIVFPSFSVFLQSLSTYTKKAKCRLLAALNGGTEKIILWHVLFLATSGQTAWELMWVRKPLNYKTWPLNEIIYF